MIRGTYQTDYETYITVQVDKTIYNGFFPPLTTTVDRKITVPPLIALILATKSCAYDPLPILDGTETGAFEIEFGTKEVQCKLMLAKYEQPSIVSEPPIQELKAVV